MYLQGLRIMTIHLLYTFIGNCPRLGKQKQKWGWEPLSHHNITFYATIVLSQYPCISTIFGASYQNYVLILIAVLILIYL